MSGLPTYLPEWEPWRKEINKRIEAADATSYLQKLCEAGCREEELLFRLAAIVAWHGKDPTRKATGLTPHQLKIAPKKLRDAAKLIEQLERPWHPDEEIPDAVTRLTTLLKSYADGLDKWTIPNLLKPSRTTLELAARCSLVAYVERATGRNHDDELSALIAAVLRKDDYFATHLTQWRSKHQNEIDLWRHSLVNPLSMRLNPSSKK